MSGSLALDGIRMRRLMVILAGAGLLLAACNTVEGVGRDMSAAGGAIADTARQVKN